MFIVFEGLDGAGTTTQSGMLAKWLRGIGRLAELTCEPTSGPMGALARLAIEGRVSVDDEALALLFAADRLDHLRQGERGLINLLSAGIDVISDRYVLSSLAYQSARGVELDWLCSMNKMALTPDVTVFIDTSAQICDARTKSRSSSVDLFDGESSLSRVENQYAKVIGYKEFVGELIIIDGSKSIDEVHNEICSQLEAWRPLRNRIEP